MFQFSDCLKRITIKSIEWEKTKYNTSQEHIWNIEEDITNIYQSSMNGVFSENELRDLK